MNSRFFSIACIKNTLKLTRLKIQNPVPTLLSAADLQNVNTKRILHRSSLQSKYLHLPATGALSRSLHTKLPKTPDLIYIPHLIRWLKTKFQFKLLQKTWDPEFTEGSFIFGTSKAICRITEIIHENNLEQLRGLLTTSALIKLKDDVSTKLNKVQRLIIKLRPEDIKILVPMNVILNKDGEHKHCRVAMRVLALKWVLQSNGSLRLVLVALQTEFLRDYTYGFGTDWTISAFDILECTILAKSRN